MNSIRRSSLVSAAFILGILSLVFLVFMPVMSMIFGSLAIVFSVLSKTEAAMEKRAKLSCFFGGVGIFISSLMIAALCMILFTNIASDNETISYLRNYTRSYAQQYLEQNGFSEDEVRSLL